LKFAVLISLLIATSAIACKVPVFRFALERWETDSYTLLYRDEADLPQFQHQNIVARHEPNLTTRFAALYPDTTELDEPFWNGDHTADLLTSPLREELLKKITAGASTVWILIEGPDQEANDTVEKNLKAFLAVAEKNLQIPEGVVRPEQLDTGEVNLADIDVKDVLRSPIPLTINFQTLRLKHGDAREAPFRQLLLGTHPNPAIRTTDEPLLVAVFGRGRMLEALPASMLNQENITGASQYLCGECSCEVKEENPGADLLLTADWETILEGSYTIIDQQLPPLAGAGEFTQPEPDVPPEPDEEAAPSPLPRNLFILAIATIGVITIASVTILRPRE